MITVCTKDMCAGCGACVESCSQNAINIIEDIRAYNAVIEKEKCIECGKCSRICPKNNPAEFRAPIEWYQGWSTSEEVRAKSSSGGFATAIASAFISSGGSVCTCKFADGRIGFQFIDTIEELASVAGSKYVKSSPYGVYHELAQRLKDGQKVLFIGLPCQAAAVQNYIGKNKSENLYTIDLICHGTPSAQLLDLYMKQKEVDIHSVSKLSFRTKNSFGISVNGKGIDGKVQDNYTTAFLTSISYTENCYSCNFARKERVSDLTIGDSWNSDLSHEEVQRGISLVLCQTAKGKMLLENSDLCLHPVDLDRAIEANHQLSHPSRKPQKRDLFMKKIKEGKSFNYIMLLIEPKREIKNIIKRLLK